MVVFTLTTPFFPKGGLGQMRSGVGEKARLCGLVAETPTGFCDWSSCPSATVGLSHGPEGPDLKLSPHLSYQPDGLCREQALRGKWGGAQKTET